MKNICLQAVTGSRAYGLNHEKSDTDRMGIFVAPTLDVSGLYWNSSDESWSDAGPEGDDTSYHEIGKFLRLVLKSNPTLLELMWMDDYEILTEEGQGILDIREKVLYTSGVQNAYIGYTKAQFERVIREYPDHKLKMARHCLRLVRQGTEILETGQMTVRVPNPQEYFDLDKLDFDSLSELMYDSIEDLKQAKSVLPDKPDVDAVKVLLRDVRRNNVT